MNYDVPYYIIYLLSCKHPILWSKNSLDTITNCDHDFSQVIWQSNTKCNRLTTQHATYDTVSASFASVTSYTEGVTSPLPTTATIPNPKTHTHTHSLEDPGRQPHAFEVCFGLNKNTHWRYTAVTTYRGEASQVQNSLSLNKTFSLNKTLSH